METIEIILLIAGVIVFVLSFVIPAKSEAISPEAKEALYKEFQTMIASDVASAKEKISDIVDETVTYSIEKTERSMERMTNEKIMAVSEYADTVLGEINKTHTEVMFLYDMLNDKHQVIKDAVTEVTQTMKKVEQASEEMAPLQEMTETVTVHKPVKKAKSDKKVIEKEKETITSEVGTEGTVGPDLSFMQGTSVNGRNNNERILELHNQGKSNVAIAKELGLGVGEVKLVIGLFEGI